MRNEHTYNLTDGPALKGPDEKTRGIAPWISTSMHSKP